MRQNNKISRAHEKVSGICKRNCEIKRKEKVKIETREEIQLEKHCREKKLFLRMKIEPKKEL